MATSAASKATSFATLFRNSPFIKQGDFRNSLVLGRIFHINNDDLYVDIGLKFHAVVKRPRENGQLYVRGSVVKMRLVDYEIATKFIGSDGPTSLLEADAVLLGLESSPVGKKQSIN